MPDPAPTQAIRGPSDAVARAVEMLRALRGLRGKLVQASELLPEELRPRAGNTTAPEPLPWKTVRRVLEEAWEADVGDVLEEVEEEPRALASTGQVHRAVRARDGVAVAVKVQAPGSEEAIRSELDVAALVARLAGAVLPALDVPGLALAGRDLALQELDHELEAASWRSMARAWRGHPLVHVPAPDTRLSTSRVLVAEWVDGAGLDELRERPQQERDRVGELLARFWWGGPYRTGWVHGDPHPGNWRLLEDGRLAVVDFGAAAPLEHGRLDRIARSYAAALRDDAAGAHAALAELGYLPDPGAAAPERLLAASRAIGAFLLAREPARIDAQTIRAAIATLEDPASGALDALAHVALPAPDLLLRRAEASLVGVLAQLEAAAPWGAICDEWWSGAAPATELGHSEAPFWARRGRR